MVQPRLGFFWATALRLGLHLNSPLTKGPPRCSVSSNSLTRIPPRPLARVPVIRSVRNSRTLSQSRAFGRRPNAVFPYPRSDEPGSTATKFPCGLLLSGAGRLRLQLNGALQNGVRAGGYLEFGVPTGGRGLGKLRRHHRLR